MRYLVSYDIADAHRRNRAGHLLLGFGERVQESVYEVEVREPQWHALSAAMDALVRYECDQWRAWRLCAADGQDVTDLGLPSALPALGSTVI